MQQLIKRLLDVVGSAILLIVLSPVILVVAIAISRKLGRPVLFSQTRPGFHSKTFTLYKFRTMTNAVDENGKKLSDDERMTDFGSFLRRTSLDELPQLWNVLKGDMSFVGPRPLLVQYLELYSPEQARRHDVKPGITGWAQIHGRRELDQDWDEKFRLDVWYVDNWSLRLDLQILWRTLAKVIRQDDIAQSGRATSDAFKGSRD